MKYSITAIFLSILFTIPGCTGGSFAPFITVMDQSEVDLGSSTSHVRDKLGYPMEMYGLLFVFKFCEV